MTLIDTHCHLQFSKLADQAEAVIKRAEDAGVRKMLCVGTTLADSQQALAIAQQSDHVWAAAGVHPHDVKDFPADGDQQLQKLLKEPKVVAMGEIGLDYFKAYSAIEVQEAVLRRQIEATLDSGLPYIFHVREAFDDFWSIYDSYPKLAGVVHSFSASRAELDQILERGLHVGLNGIMTFTNDKEQLAAAKAVPLDKLVFETDAPFLAPKPDRGQTCEPKHIRIIAEFLANLRGQSVDELAAATTQNAEALFGI